MVRMTLSVSTETDELSFLARNGLKQNLCTPIELALHNDCIYQSVKV